MPKDEWAKLRRRDIGRKAINDGQAYFAGTKKKRRRKATAYGRRLNRHFVRLMLWIEKAPNDCL